MNIKTVKTIVFLLVHSEYYTVGNASKAKLKNSKLALPCLNRVKLLDIDSEDCKLNGIISQKNTNLFFVESSGRNHLPVRYACAIESAVKNTGLKNIIVAMTSPYLDISANNATCHLYMEHYEKNIRFRYVNVDTIFKGTPLQKLHAEGKLRYHEKKHEWGQYSDAIRIVLIQHYGGYYSDLDMIFLRPLVNTDGEMLQNFVVGNAIHNHLDHSIASEVNGGNLINNAIFHNDAGHLFLKKVIDIFPVYFQSGIWTSSGPQLFTQAIKELCLKSLTPSELNLCSGINLFNSKRFYPIDWFHSSILFEPHDQYFWEELFSSAYVVHFYGSLPAYNKNVLQPKFYGENMPAYAKIGPENCPSSFHSTKVF